MVVSDLFMNVLELKVFNKGFLSVIGPELEEWFS